MIHIYDSTTLPVSRWRNGGGETREIISLPPGKADFAWRASIATLDRDSDFSAFPGIDRIITLLSGGVALYSEGQLRQQLQTGQPFAFNGEETISARLTGGPGTDFNLMSRRESHHGSAGVTRKAFHPPAADGGVVYVLAGQWQHSRGQLATGQGAWWEHTPDSFTPVSPDALLLWGCITPINRDL